MSERSGLSTGYVGITGVSSLRWALVGVCLVVWTSPAWGQCTEEVKLTASDGAANDAFGYSVAISGDTMVIGAPWDDGARGSAYVFVRSGGSWIQQAKLTASDGAANDLFGYSVAVSGDSVVVGAVHDVIGLNDGQGSAYVFIKPGGGWSDMTQTAKLTASDGANGDSFGYSAAVTGDTVVVGAIGPNGDQGSAYVFVMPGGGWSNTTQTAKLTASDGAAGDFFGDSVSVSGDTIVLGARLDDNGANGNQGSAYVFVMPGGGWSNMTQTSKLTASDGEVSDVFGASVAVFGDTIVVGAGEDDIGLNGDQGSAYVFVKPGGGWTDMTQTAKLTASDGAAGDFFGYSVAVSDDTIVAGAISDDIGLNADQGSAYVFQCTPLCSPPNCNNHGTCVSGSCVCDTGFAGAACDQCAPDHYNYPTCTFCQEATTCSSNGTCNGLGGCDCDIGFAGAACDQCAPNYFNYPNCTFCQAATTCSGNGTCNALGGCNCNTGYAGTACNQCAPDHYDYPTCTFCRAATTCSGNGTCNALGGCNCDTGYAGTACDQCAPNYYDFPTCTFCQATTTCSGNGVCDSKGSCVCNTGWTGPNCATPATPIADPTGIKKSRFISFVVPGTAPLLNKEGVGGGRTIVSQTSAENDPPVSPLGKGGGIAAAANETALRVKLTSLHHVLPVYTNGASIAFTLFEGQSMWVGPPSQYVESGSDPTQFMASNLQCNPFYQDWSTVGLLAVTGEAIVPSSSYDVENLAFACLGLETTAPCLSGGANVSAALTIKTARSGDVVAAFQDPDLAASQPDFDDIGSLVNKFKSLLGAPIKAHAKLYGVDARGLMDLSPDVGFDDIPLCVDGFKGRAYPYKPGMCAGAPATACKDNADCGANPPCILCP